MTTATLHIDSPGWAPGAAIPMRYSCDGTNVSPELHWSDPPPGTKAFALVAEDPDAPRGIWTHWVIYNLPAACHGLPEAVPQHDIVPGLGMQGVNDFQKVGYGGPCPPRGHAHRYHFRLYCLDADLHLPPRLTRVQLLEAIKGHVIGEVELTGRYKR